MKDMGSRHTSESTMKDTKGMKEYEASIFRAQGSVRVSFKPFMVRTSF